MESQVKQPGQQQQQQQHQRQRYYAQGEQQFEVQKRIKKRLASFIKKEKTVRGNDKKKNGFNVQIMETKENRMTVYEKNQKNVIPCRKNPKKRQ